MPKEEGSPRFGPGRWVTIRDSGAHVRVEVWSPIAAAYRLRSGRKAVLFATEEELDPVPAHPEAHLGKYWNSCQAPGCGAPLTPELAVCPQCQAPTCTCGRCACKRRAAAPRARAKRPPKKVAAG